MSHISPLGNKARDTFHSPGLYLAVTNDAGASTRSNKEVLRKGTYDGHDGYASSPDGDEPTWQDRTDPQLVRRVARRAYGMDAPYELPEPHAQAAGALAHSHRNLAALHRAAIANGHEYHMYNAMQSQAQAPRGGQRPLPGGAPGSLTPLGHYHTAMAAQHEQHYRNLQNNLEPENPLQVANHGALMEHLGDQAVEPHYENEALGGQIAGIGRSITGNQSPKATKLASTALTHLQGLQGAYGNHAQLAATHHTLLSGLSAPSEPPSL
jgi:hypothetical protein